MWSRRELKEKAKHSLKMNYWKCVMAALLLTLIGAGAGTGGTRQVFSWMHGGSSEDDAGIQEYNGYYDDGSGWYEDWGYEDEEVYGEYEDEESEFEDYEGVDEIMARLGKLCGTLPNGEFDTGKGISVMFAVLFLFMIFVILLVVVLLIVLPIEIFIVNPLEVGIRRFFAKNLQEQANIREVCFAFDHHYKNTVKIMFFRGLYVFLWSLLLVIPGIIKSYEYRMIPYIIEENPGIGNEEAFARSRILMHGNKWKAFVLDLSFLGWYILSGLTIGILGIFYVSPYVAQTRAALYLKLKEQDLNRFTANLR